MPVDLQTKNSIAETADLKDSLFSDDLKPIVKKIGEGKRLSADDALVLFNTNDLHGLGILANAAVRERHGNNITYVINGHINYSNFCVLSCQFCAWARKKKNEDRPGGYEHPPEDIFKRAGQLAEAGATEIHIVGGLNPDLKMDYYTEVLSGLRERFPTIGRKCFTGTEISYFARKFRKSISDILKELKDAGLSSLPGGGAETLNDDVRKDICKGKESVEQWLEVHREAHKLDLHSNATILYGHLEKTEHLVEHLMHLRNLQDETKGFLALIPLPYHPDNNRLNIQHRPSAVRSLKVFAVSRLLLDNFPHIKAYWIAQTQAVSQASLQYGVSDFDGTAHTEEIYHAAGAQTPIGLPVDEIRRLIEEAGFNAVERNHIYQRVERDSDDMRKWMLKD